MPLEEIETHQEDSADDGGIIVMAPDEPEDE
jgi:hypothetical protein